MKRVLGIGLIVLLSTCAIAQEKELIKSIAFGFKAKNGYYRTDSAKQSVKEIAALNANYVNLIVSVMQDNYYSTRVYRDYEYTVDNAELEEIIKLFHENGVDVMLNPIIEIHDGSWRGQITFPRMMNLFEGVNTDYAARWFDSYTQCLVSYAKIAERLNVKILNLGAELDGVVKYNDHWKNLIAKVKAVYSGKLICQMTSRLTEETSNFPDWINEVDILGVNFYRPATDRDIELVEAPSVKEMMATMKTHIPQIQSIHERFDKPILFSETGCRSRLGASQRPSDWKQPGPYNGIEQANFMEAVFRTFIGQDWWLGMSWWKWDEHQYREQYHDDPEGDKGFTIKGKPAEKRMKQIYGED